VDADASSEPLPDPNAQLDASVDADALATDATSEAAPEDSAPPDAPADTAAPVLKPPVFTTVAPVVELAYSEQTSDPTLTDDLKTMYFLSKRPGGPGNADVWVAKRDSAAGAFSGLAPVNEVNTPGVEASPAISGDGLTLWVASRWMAVDNADGDYHDIWCSSRADAGSSWSTLAFVRELNSAQDDTPRPPGAGGLIMPVTSRRDSVTTYYTYLAFRASVSAPFTVTRRVSELEVPGFNVADAFLTRDGQQIYFTRAGNNKGDIYWARLDPATGLFTDAQALGAPINTVDFDDRDPWVSPDGTRMYFASDRGGALNIYEARR
jgi:hypothetical protein